MTTQIIRDAPIGQLVRLLTRNKYFKYPEEQDGFVLPFGYSDSTPEVPANDSASTTATESDAGSITEKKEDPSQSSSDEADNALRLAPTLPDIDEVPNTPTARPRNRDSRNRDSRIRDSTGRPLSWVVSRPDLSKRNTRADLEDAYNDAILQETIKREPSRPLTPEKTADGRILVDWYATDDPENPQNWTGSRKTIVVLQIYLYTLAVYISSAIYTPSVPDVIEIFGVSSTVASLGLSIYVAGYGWGPLLFSPMSEIPIIGRNPPYIVTFFIFLILSIVVSVVNNFPAFVVLRFLQGFFGSPALATGGASIGDIYSLMEMPYYLTGWAAFATAGPAIGPIISGFSVPKTNWHWSMWEIVWLAAPTFISLLFFLPETSAQNILLRRARRLRKLTGNSNLVSQSEIDQSKLTVNEVVVSNLWRPVQINLLDPSVAFTSIYIGLLYGIFYSFFEVFPLVYGAGNPTSPHPTEGYGMNIGQQGLVFLSMTVGVSIAIAIYLGYLYFYFDPWVRANGIGAPERRLAPGLVASIIAPCGLFIFAWTAQYAPRYNWAIPTVGVVVFIIPVFILFQVIFIYIPLTYPAYAASLFAGNDAVRSSIAAGAIHFAHPLFHNLGVARGTSLLGGLTFIGVIGIWTLWLYGAKLRGMSRFAAK